MDILVKSHSHHYPGLVGRKRPSKNSEIILKLIEPQKSNLLNVGKVLLLAKQTQARAETTHGAELEVTQKLHEET